MENKVLVTGSSGFVGGHLCDKLSSLGFSVCGLDKVKPSRNVRLDEFVHMDLCNILDMGCWLRQFDYVFHLAAEVGLSASGCWLYESAPVWRVNVDALYKLVKLVNPKKFINVSTAALYKENLNLKETSSFNCINAYGYTKAIGENVVANSGLPYVSFRPGTIVGPYGRSYVNRLVYECVHGLESVVFNDGLNIRSFVDVTDVVDALIHGMGLNGVYNLASDEGTKVLDVIDLVKRIGAKHGYEINYRLVPDVPSGLAKEVSLNNRKLVNTGWRQNVNLYSMINRLFNFYQNNLDVEPPRWGE